MTRDRRGPLALALVLAGCGVEELPLAGQGGGPTSGGSSGGGSGDDSDGEAPEDRVCGSWLEDEVPLTAPAASALPFSDVAGPAGLRRAQFHPVGGGACLATYDGAETPLSWCDPEWLTGGVAVGDYDGDGLDDLFVPRYDAPDLLYRNLGDGRFRDVAAEVGLTACTRSSGAAWGDVDLDGDLDLFVTTTLATRTLLYVNDGGRLVEAGEERGVAQTVGGSDVHVGTSIALGDYDGDGWLDAFVGQWSSHMPTGSTDAAPRSRLYHNLGADAPGVFEDVTDRVGLEISNRRPAVGEVVFAAHFSDLDDDGRLDLAVVSDWGDSQLFWNLGADGFVDGTREAAIGSEKNGMGSAIADFDGDGRLDWFVTAISSIDGSCAVCGDGNRMYRNLGGRRFEDVTDRAGVRDGGWGWGTVAFDADNDGDLDLAMTEGWPMPEQLTARGPRLWRNGGDGRMERIDVGIEEPSVQGRALVVLDQDADGDLDLLEILHADAPRLFANDWAAGRHFLRIRATRGAGTGPGERVRVTLQAVAGGPVRVEEVGNHAQYLGHGELTAHFGLGEQAGPIHEVRVRWPDGVERVLHDVAPDRLVLVQRPAD